MALTTQDFLHGIDLTGYAQATGADLNSLVDLGAPFDDGGGVGKGLTLVTIDSALNTPVVPDSNATTKWKRYIWIRIPFTGVTDAPKIYAWNSNAPNDATYKRWLQITVDISALTALANLALTTANAAQNTATNANNIANAANASASAANATANAANTNANTALANAATAEADALAAQALANAAQAQANAALAAASAPRNITAILNPGAAGQLIRTNNAGSAVEWFNLIDKYAKLSYSPAKNTAPQVLTAADWTKIHVDTKDIDYGNLASIFNDIITFNSPGIYRVEIEVPVSSSARFKAVLVDTDSNLVLLVGTNCGGDTTDSNSPFSKISGIINISSSSKNLAVYAYTSDGGKLGPATALNIDYPKIAGVATNEVYLVVEIWKLN